jgi:hypothetical protein
MIADGKIAFDLEYGMSQFILIINAAADKDTQVRFGKFHFFAGAYFNSA